MKETIMYAIPSRLTPKAKKVAGIMFRDGGITHLTALHYGIGSVTKEVARIRDAMPTNYRVTTDKRVDANGNEYTRWTLVKKGN
jgi:hypothetical protein